MGREQEFLSVLRRIAQTPLWGEAIASPSERADYAATQQYDVGLEAFIPSADTESEQLREAVELARMALLLVDADQADAEPCPAVSAGLHP